MTDNQGWQCPNCGKAHAQWVMTCPEKAKVSGCEHVWITDSAGKRCAKCYQPWNGSGIFDPRCGHD